MFLKIMFRKKKLEILEIQLPGLQNVKRKGSWVRPLWYRAEITNMNGLAKRQAKQTKTKQENKNAHIYRCKQQATLFEHTQDLPVMFRVFQATS